MLETEFLGRRLRSPFFLPSGIVGDISHLADLDLSWCGLFVSKTITLQPRKGNEGVRVWDLPCGMLNSIGLANEGVEAFVRETLPRLVSLETEVLVSFSVYSEEEISGFEDLFAQGLWAVELNLSCPNVRHGARGLIAQDLDLSYRLVRAVREALNRATALVVKLSPDVPFIEDVADAVISAGASALTIANTFPAVAVDVSRGRFVFERVVAGMSGPAIHSIVLHRIWRVRSRFPDVPILGVGGVWDRDSALAMAMAGADLVGIGSALYHDPTIGVRIAREVEEFLEEQGCSWADVVGKAYGDI